MSDPINHLGSIWLENIYEINKCGGGIFLWRVDSFKIGKRDFTFIREMRVCIYSKVPIIRTVRRASSAVHSMYSRTGIRTSTYNRHFGVHIRKKFLKIFLKVS